MHKIHQLMAILELAVYFVLPVLAGAVAIYGLRKYRERVEQHHVSLRR